ALMAPVSAHAARTQKDKPARRQRVVKNTRIELRTTKKVVVNKKFVRVKPAKTIDGDVIFGVQARLTSDPHPHAREHVRLGRSLASRLPARPKTKIGRFVKVLGHIAGALINAPKVDTPEGQLGTVPGGTAIQNGVSMEDV